MKDFDRNKNNVLAIVMLVIFVVWAWSLPGCTGSGTGGADQKKKDFAQAQQMAGQWVRPDGGYILELREIKKNGSLQAAYFNPQPIKVFSARWSRRDGKINLFVELRDVNYPGSKYNLQYDPVSDRLQGTYFQAVERKTFNIEFVRVK
jgi:hypothetical protein